jgi:alkaline phosphatase
MRGAGKLLGMAYGGGIRRTVGAIVLLTAGIAGGVWFERRGGAERRDLVLEKAAPGGATASPLMVPPLPATSSGKVRNVILLIADGMGIAHSTAARIETFGSNGSFVFERLPITGLLSTHSADSWVGSSDSNATAMASGKKTANGRIGVDLEGRTLVGLAERARAAGRPVGIVSTSQIFDATPAAFYAHIAVRADTEGIVEQLLGSGLDFVAGGGIEGFLPEAQGGLRTDGRNLLREATARGIAVATDLAALQALDRLPAWALYPGKTLGESPPRPTLADLTERALALLDGEARKRGRGFLLMLEEEGVDTASHVNDFGRVTGAVRRFDAAVERAVRFAIADGETLVVMVSDHATGGLTIDHTSKLDLLRVAWTSRKHTGEAVAVYAYGPGESAAAFSGRYDNTELAPRIARATGLD